MFPRGTLYGLFVINEKEENITERYFSTLTKVFCFDYVKAWIWKHENHE